MTARVLTWMLEQLRLNSPIVLATVVEAKGSVPGKTGARLAMNRYEEWVGTVGGAGLEHRVLNRCKEMIQENKATSEVHTFGLNKGAKGYEVQALDSLCGGLVTISLELMLPMPHVLLMGGGHCSEAITKLLPTKGWSYSVQDTRKEFTTNDLYPDAIERHHSTVESFFSNESAETMTRFSDVLLLGHDYSEDLDRLQRLLHLAESANLSLDGKVFPRIGAIGSRTKWNSFSKSCIEAGIQASILGDVRCPIGLNIGAESPEEIAIAVIAEILSMHKNADVHAPNWRDR